MYQNTVIVGNLGKDPEMKYMPNTTPLTTFSVAVSRTWNDKLGVKQTETTWFKVEVWGSQAESCHKFLHKGSKVLVEGRVAVEAWTSKDGKPAATLVLKSDTVKFLDGKTEANGSHGDTSTHTEQEKETIPF